MNNQTNVNSESQKLIQLAAQFAFMGDIDNFSKVEHKLCGDIYLNTQMKKMIFLINSTLFNHYREYAFIRQAK